MKKLILSGLLAIVISPCVLSQRHEILLKHDWRFSQADDSAAIKPEYDDSRWKEVSVPHDWAITGPFDRKHDLQTVAVTQDGETTATLKTGRSGGLPYI